MSDPISDLKRELLAAAERQHRFGAVSRARPRSRARRGGSRLLLIAATFAIAAAVTLVVTTPWSSSPGVLEQAQAALTAPAGMILHAKWQTTATSTDPACTVTRAPHEVWIDGTPPHRYRLLTNDFGEGSAPGVRALVCWRGTAAEFGGTQESFDALRFLPPNTLVRWQLRYVRELDPATRLREAIEAGTAHDEGTTQLDGRTVQRIRIGPQSDCPEPPDPPDPVAPPCSREPGYWYVDPETFYPVRTEGTGFLMEVGGSDVLRLRIVEQFLTFEYLPRTEANLALTDIRAQHPNATGP
jgi:hypothetical protein